MPMTAECKTDLHSYSNELQKLCIKYNLFKKTLFDSRAIYYLKVRLAFVTDGIGWTSIVYLVRIGPTLVKWAIPREAGLIFTRVTTVSIREQVYPHTDIAVAAGHE